MRIIVFVLLAGVALGGLLPARAQDGMPMHMHPGAMPPAAAADARELVRLPAPMQEHMLGNMRDHLATLNEIIGALGDGNFEAAAKVAERRLGMSSLALHDAAHMAPFMPQPMQDMGTGMHRAASRLVVVLQDAAVVPSAESMREVSRALHAVTSACTACHAAYRIR